MRLIPKLEQTCTLDRLTQLPVRQAKNRKLYAAHTLTHLGCPLAEGFVPWLAVVGAPPSNLRQAFKLAEQRIDCRYGH
ncbi:hypothetical protein [Streptomyces sp. NPDC054987]